MRRPSLRPLALLALAALMLAPACTKSVDAAQARAVRAYAEALEPALQAETLSELRQAASPAEVERVRLYVGMQLEERRRRMRANLLDQQVVSTRVDGKDRAVVETVEEWSMVYIERDSGREVGHEDRKESLTYHLVRVRGRWFVDSLTVR